MRSMRFWCDECRKEIGRPECTWSGCELNGWSNFDFCSYRCAEPFAERMRRDWATKTIGEGA